MAKKTMQQNKKGQVTIFIFLAILIVGGILAYLFYLKPTSTSSGAASLKIESCVSEVLESALVDLGKSGGFVNPSFTYQYQGEDFSYLCYTNDYYQTCTVQSPFPEKMFLSNLEETTKEDISFCYTDSINDLRKKGYDVPDKVPEFTIEFEPGKIIVVFEGGITITRESSQTIGELKVETVSPIYEMLIIATTILQQEVQFGDSDVTTLMQIYPEFIIDKIKRDDGTTVYIILDKSTQTKYQFASKSLPWPPGYGLAQ
jgi:hypothetical protein